MALVSLACRVSKLPPNSFRICLARAKRNSNLLSNSCLAPTNNISMQWRILISKQTSTLVLRLALARTWAARQTRLALVRVHLRRSKLVAPRSRVWAYCLRLFRSCQCLVFRLTKEKKLILRNLRALMKTGCLFMLSGIRAIQNPTPKLSAQWLKMFRKNILKMLWKLEVGLPFVLTGR